MLEVVECEALATLQDAGRFGWRRFGVPAGGPMDRFAFQAASLLAGNDSEAALEVGGGDLALRAAHDCVIAAAGAGYELRVNDWEFPLWGACFVRGGWLVRLKRTAGGMWAYLAVPGGFQAAPVLGSRATHLRGGFGGLDGRALQPGEVLHFAQPGSRLMEFAGRTLREEARPGYASSPQVDVIAGPQSDDFDDDSRAAFFSGTYQLSASSDRMGYRLQGPALRSRRATELTSEGMAPGAIQVPPDGQPIAMMADCATTGGYPKVACVTSASLPLLAQCTPGGSEVRFREVTVEAAQSAYRSQMERLRHGVVEADD